MNYFFGISKLRKVPINNIGAIFNDLLQAQVSLERVEKFMFSEDIDTSYIRKIKSKDINSSAINIKNGNFSWTSKKDKTPEQNGIEDSLSNKPILKNINMDIKKGSFVAILGE